MKNSKYVCNDTFVAKDGSIVNFSDVLNSIDNQFGRYVFNHGWYLSEEDKEDLFQSLAERAWQYRNSFDPREGNVDQWVSRILRNRTADCLNRYTRIQKPLTRLEVVRRDKDGRESYSYVVEPQADMDPLDDELGSLNASRYILSKVNGLTGEQALMLRMAIDEFKAAEIAEYTGHKANEVSSTLCRARKNIEKALGSSFLREYGFAK